MSWNLGGLLLVLQRRSFLMMIARDSPVSCSDLDFPSLNQSNGVVDTMLPLASRWHFGATVTVASKEDSLWIFFLLKDCLNYGNLVVVVGFAPLRVDLLSKFSKILFREREKLRVLGKNVDFFDISPNNSNFFFDGAPVG